MTSSSDADEQPRSSAVEPWDRRLLGAAARITGNADRARTDAALVLALADLWHARSVTLYAIDDTQPGTCRPATSLEDGSLTRHEATAGEPAVALSRIPGAREAMLCRRASLRADGASVLFPLCSRKGQFTCLLDVALHTPVAAAAAGADLIGALLDVYDNHVRIIEDSERDALTSLRNRRTFDQLLIGLVRDRSAQDPCPTGSRRVSRAKRADKWLAVLDLDRFKDINDTYGHLFGDEVLILVANLMRESFRIQDSLFRFGGEEFVVVLQDTDQAGATTAFERFRTRLADYRFPQIGQVTISGGYTEIAPGQLPSEILNRADAALYVAKQRGRNRCCCYELLVDEGELAPSQRSAGAGFELFL